MSFIPHVKSFLVFHMKQEKTYFEVFAIFTKRKQGRGKTNFGWKKIKKSHSKENSPRKKCSKKKKNTLEKTKLEFLNY